MPYTILYHPKVKEEDVNLLDKKQRSIIAKAIETRLTNEPEKYGKPLRGSLKGYWKLRVGDVRVMFKIVGNEVQVLGIINRKIVYEKILKRL
ncbi:MAG TPA: type II toxin-antitoxin system RelE/ParE family toxin [Thermodesulfobacteriota bacterium]|nr:type II toxin-antitoxin system RelE/ParE family toxin [Thermodesulfobacteriota bacterium]